MGIQMNQKEPTKTVMIISNRKNPLVSQGFYKKFSAVRVKTTITYDDQQDKDYIRNTALAHRGKNSRQIIGGQQGH